MKKKVGIIVGVIVIVVAIVVGVVFLGPDKEPEDNTIINAIDLNTLDLKEYGITAEYDISGPQKTSVGDVYVVRAQNEDYGTTAHLFVTTENDVLHTNTEAMCFPMDLRNDYELIIENVDGEDGDEIIMKINTGGNGGNGVYDIFICKVLEDKLQKIEIRDESPFKVTLEAPFTVVFTNEDFKYEKKVVLKYDGEWLFNNDGTPKEYDEYDGGFYPPHDIKVKPDGDETTEKCIVSLTSWSSLSKYGNDEVNSVVDYVYDEKTQSLVMHNAYIDVIENTSELAPMSNTIDLNTIELTEYGLSSDYEISEPYYTSQGCAYYVCDYSDSKTYLFVTTQKEVLYVETNGYTAGAFKLSERPEYYFNLQYENVDDELGDEIFLQVNMFAASAPAYDTTVWKVTDNKLQRIEFSDEEPFKIISIDEKTVAFKNDSFGVDKVITFEQSIYYMGDTGEPYDNGNEQLFKFYDLFYSPSEMLVSEQATDDGTTYGVVSLTSSCRANSLDENGLVVEAVVDYKYNGKTKKLEVCNANIELVEPVEY